MKTLWILFLFLVFLLSSISDLLAQNSNLVTVADYAVFLNEVASSDPYHLYNDIMGSDPATACILRSGMPGKYSYALIEGRENVPINNIKWFDEARFCNWQESRLQVTGYRLQENETEDGAYTLDESDDIALKNFNAVYWIEDDDASDPVLGSSHGYFSVASNGPLTLMFSGDVGVTTSDEAAIFVREFFEGIFVAIAAEEGIRFNGGELVEDRNAGEMPGDEPRQRIENSETSSGSGLQGTRTAPRLLEHQPLEKEDACYENRSITSMQLMSDRTISDAGPLWASSLNISTHENAFIESSNHPKKGTLEGTPVVNVSKFIAIQNKIFFFITPHCLPADFSLRWIAYELPRLCQKISSATF